MIGRQLEGYRILEAVDAGGGVTGLYLAQQQGTGRSLFLKVLSEAVGESRAALDRMRGDIAAIGALGHPNVVPVEAVERNGGLCCAVMRRVTGRPVAGLVPATGMELRPLLALSIPLADALATAHRAGRAHRGLCPGYLFLRDDGGLDILGFGLLEVAPAAAVDEEEAPTQPLDAESLISALRFRAPEQLRGQAPDERSDIFALGLVLFALATGRYPFTGRDPTHLTSAILHDEPVALRRLRPDLPPHLDRLVRRCLAKKPSRRSPTAEELCGELADLWPRGGGGRPSRPSLASGAGTRVGGLVPPTVPSVAVLPFENVSGRPEDEFLCSGTTIDLITTLTKLRDLLVIAQNSVFLYKGRPLDVRAVGRELGVRHLVLGAIERLDGRISVEVRLVDAASARVLWQERFERKLSDIFAVQDEITHRIVTELDVRLLEGEQARAWHQSTPSLTAYERYIEGVEQLFRMTPEGTAAGARLLTDALEIDPRFAQAWAMLGICHSLDFRYGWNKPLDRSMVEMLAASSKARELDANLPMAHTLLGHVALACHEADEAVEHSRRAVELAPGSSLHRASLANCYAYAGRPREALLEVEKAIRSSPFYPAWYEMIRGDSYALLDRPRDAIAAYRANLVRTPQFLLARIRLVATLALLEELDEARAQVVELLELRPGFRLSRFAAEWGPRAMPYKDPAHFTETVRGLELAGL